MGTKSGVSEAHPFNQADLSSEANFSQNQFLHKKGNIMEVVIVYLLILLCILGVFFVVFNLSKSDQFYSLESRLIFDLMMDYKLAEEIQKTCDKFRIVNKLEAELVIYQCAQQGKITIKDFYEIRECFPGMIKNSSVFKSRIHLGFDTFDEFLKEIGVKK